LRKSLEHALYASHPLLFRQKDLTAAESAMARGIECADGWFAILDGMCDALCIHRRQAGHPLIEIAQVKQKFAALTVYIDGRCEWCAGTIDFACRLSRHVCEETGRPGLLMTKGRMLRTLAEDVGNREGYRRYANDSCALVGIAPHAREEGLPPGWLAIVSVLRASAGLDGSGSTLRFGHAGGQLLVDSQSRAEGLSGAVACARALAVRSDPLTGVMSTPQPDGVDEVDQTYQQ